jgi:hypothetical protein
MPFYSHRSNDPVLLSVKRMKINLHKLKQIGPNGNLNSLWETAGHIWKALYWICELTKDAKIKNDAWTVREALGQIISKNHHIDLEHFDQAVHKITDSYNKIQERC